ncbi:MAG: hypothetical protein KJ667_05825 [Alphaproteobacteria bacterium]|nr:hypothetical protein [Alphaproteobacteria bacterium]
MTTNELITEIEDAVRREKLEKAAKEYGPYVLAGCLLAILFTGLMAGWSSWQTRTNAAHTAAILQAVEGPNTARNLSETAATLGAGQELVARLASAGLYLQEENKAEALIQFQQAAADKSAPALLRDMALLQSVRLEWEAGGETVDAQTLLNKLAPLANDKNNAWQAHAQVQSALITAHGLNDFAAARKHLEPVLTRKDNLPPSLLMRARALDHIYGLKIENKADAAPVKTETQG